MPGDVQRSQDAGLGYHVWKMGIRNSELGAGMLGSGLPATATHDNATGRFPYGIRPAGELATVSGF